MKTHLRRSVRSRTQPSLCHLSSTLRGVLGMLLLASGTALGQATVSGSVTTTVSFPATTVGASAPVQNVVLQLTATETLTSITVPVSQGNRQEYTVGAVTGCKVDGSTTNMTGTTCTVPITFTPAYPGQRPAPLHVVTSTGNINFGLLGSGTGPLVAFAPGVLRTATGTGVSGYGYDGAQANESGIGSAGGGVTDSAGNFYFADTVGNAVRKITLSTGLITTVAGSGAHGFSGDGGPATSATLYGPSDVAIDSAGNLYIADTNNHRVRKVTAATGIITTVAGNGTLGSTGDNGPATSAEIGIVGIAVDGAGNLYIAETNTDTIRKVTASTGVITTVAGNGQEGYSGDTGPAISAKLDYPSSIAVDAAGNLYIADGENDVIRKVNAATGIITTVAGDGSTDYQGDGGPAINASLNDPTSVKVDAAGDLYIADYLNYVVRKVNAATGIITTIAGNGKHPYTADGVANTVAIAPQFLTLDGAGNIFVGDGGTPRIYEINESTTSLLYPTITLVGQKDTGDDPKTVALANIGNSALTLSVPAYDSNPTISPGWLVDSASTCPVLNTSSSASNLAAGASCTYALDFEPVATGATSGTLNVTDNSLNATGSTQTVMLTGTGANQLPTTVTLTSSLNPAAQQKDVSFSALIAYSNGTAVPTGTVQFTVDGVALGSTATVINGYVFAVPISTLSPGDHTVLAVFTPSTPATVAGSSATLTETILPTIAAVSLTSPQSSLSFPTTAVASSAPVQNITFRLTAAASVSSITVPISQGNKQEYTVGTTTGCAVDGTTINPSGTVCTVPITFTPAYPGLRLAPLQIATSTGNIHYGLNGIGTGPLAVLVPGILSRIAGTGSESSSGDNGKATYASVGFPVGGVTDNAGNFYFADRNNFTIRKIDMTTGLIAAIAGNGSTGYTGDGGLATHASFNRINDVAIDSAGNIYIADSGNSVVRKVTVATGVVTTIAGNGTAGNTGDNGPATSAKISNPTGLVVDTAGNLYISDGASGVVREVAATTGVITTVAGNGTQGYKGDAGSATSAELTSPQGLALDLSGNLYIADSGANVIRKVTLATGIISTAAGTGAEDYSGDGGLATAATLDEPDFVKLDAAGNLYIADSQNDAIRKVNAATGIISTIAGDGFNDVSNSFGYPATTADLNSEGLAIDGAGNILISDEDDSYIVEISASSASLTYPTITAVGATDTTDGAKSVLLTNDGNSPLTLPPPSTGTNPVISASWILDSASTCPQLSSGSGAYTLAASASCTYALDFKPTTTGTVAGTLKVTDNSLNTATSTQTVNLIGATGSSSSSNYYTITTVTSSQNPSSFGQGVALVASVTSAPAYQNYLSGTVQVYVDGVAYGPATHAGFGSISMPPVITTLSVGPHSITATFTASPTAYYPFLTSTSAPLIQTVVAPHQTGTAADAFVVTRNDDPDEILSFLPDGIPTEVGIASNCVNQTTSSPYQTGGTNNTLCSLRDAIAAAGGTSGALVTFSDSVASKSKPGVITADGDFQINSPFTLQGPGSTALTLTGGADLLIETTGLTTFTGITLLDAGDVPLDNDLGDTALNDITVIGQTDAVAFQVGSATITNSSFLQGGEDADAIYAAGNLQISNTLFRGIKGHPVNVNGGVVSIVNSVFDANLGLNNGFEDDPNGGAILAQGATKLTITSTTFTGNADPHGGAIYLRDTSSLTVANSTFSGNVASMKSIIENAGTGAMTIRNTTIYGNTDNNNGNPISFTTTPPTVTNTIIAGENGMPAGGSCAGCINGGTNLIGVDPQLGPLGNYSPMPQVPTLETYVPLPGSPAVCTGSAATDTTDELGYPRPNGSCYDIGAVQTAFALAFTVQPTTTPVGTNITPAPVVQLTERGVPLSGETIQLTDSLGASSLSGTIVASTGGDGNATYTGVAPLKSGSQTLTATFGVLTATSNSFSTSTTVAVTPTVTLAINPTSQTYGTAIAAGTFTGTAMNGSTVAPGTFTYTAAASGGGAPITVVPGTTVLPAGSYIVTANFTPADTTAYNAASSAATVANYTVTKATATVTLGNLNASYDGNPHAATATTTPANLSVSFAYNGSAAVPSAAGTYTVVATVSDANYTGTATGTLTIATTITPATITLGNLSATYDGNLHPITVTTSPTGVTVSVTYNGSATAPTAAGSYAVVATVTDPKYTGSATGTLVIAKAAAAVTLGTLTATYDGTIHAVNATSTPTGLAINVTYNGSATAPATAGSYAIVATVTDANYTGSSTGTLVIAKAAATLTLGGLNVPYDGGAHTPSETTTPAGLAVSFTYNGSATAPSAPGSYAVVATIMDINYTGSATGTLVIVPGTGDFTFTSTGSTAMTVVPGSSVTYGFTLSPTGGALAGTIAFTATGLPANATVSFTPTSLSGSTTAQSVVMKVTTHTAVGAITLPAGHNLPTVALALLLLPLAGSRKLRTRLRQRTLLTLLLVLGTLAGSAAITGCGTGNGFFQSQSGNYSITVTASGGGLQHSANVTLNVQ